MYRKIEGFAVVTGGARRRLAPPWRNNWPGRATDVVINYVSDRSTPVAQQRRTG